MRQTSIGVLRDASVGLDDALADALARGETLEPGGPVDGPGGRHRLHPSRGQASLPTHEEALGVDAPADS